MTKRVRKVKQKQYTVTIMETVQSDFMIAASSQRKAIDIARALYRSGELVLEPGELYKVAFRALPVTIAELKNPQT